MTNHKRRRQQSEPIRIRSNYMKLAPSAGKCARQLAIGSLHNKYTFPRSGCTKIRERAKSRRAGLKCGQNLFERERFVRGLSDWFWFCFSLAEKMARALSTTKVVFTWYRGDFHPGSLLWFCIRLRDTTTKCHAAGRRESYRCEFTPVLVPERDFYPGTKIHSGVM